MGVANEINVRELRKKASNPGALGKYAVLGRLFLGTEGKGDDYYIDGFIDFLHHLIHDFRMPGLKKYGVPAGDIEKICRATGLKNNPVTLSREDLIEIISSRLI
jgi:alcohol dehydrogenase class IV